MDKLIIELSAFFTRLIDHNSSTGRYLQYLETAITEFVDTGTKQQAYEIYRLFFDIYHKAVDQQKSFLDLFDMLSKYEEDVAVVNDRQRDHFLHSVNVFILGLYIYIKNSALRQLFAAQVPSYSQYPSFAKIDEEFLFCWGIAALFHDIGYPVEIISNQIKKYIHFISTSGSDGPDPRPFIDFLDFAALDSIKETNADAIGKAAFMSSDPALASINVLKPSDLLAYRISRSFDLSLDTMVTAIDNYLSTMQQKSFVDHGFFSAIIVLKWYGEMLQVAQGPSDLLFGEITLASEAILLHNYYAGTLMRKPFELEVMQPEANPLAFLLILCDESQEWNRQGYGEADRNLLFIQTSQIEVTEDALHIKYITEAGIFPDDFADKRKQALYKRLALDALFASGVEMSTETRSDYYVENKLSNLFMPRLLIDKLEDLAQMIHADYVAKQRERNHDEELAYPSWDSLPPSLKYSNIRQAAAIADKLSRVGCYLDTANASDTAFGRASSTALTGSIVLEFSSQEIEELAEYEHELWVQERLDSGWRYAEERDVKQKLSPYLVDYAELSEEIKELDRDTIRNIIPLVSAVGLKVFRGMEMTSHA